MTSSHRSTLTDTTSAVNATAPAEVESARQGGDCLLDVPRDPLSAGRELSDEVPVEQRAGERIDEVIDTKIGQFAALDGKSNDLREGSGKSTVSAALAERVEPGVHLESDWFYRWIRSGFIAPHLPASRAQNTAVMDITADAAAGYASAGYVVFWDGIVGPWFLDQVARRLSARSIPLRYLILRIERNEALRRVRQRDGTTETSGAETMWDKFVEVGVYESHVVDAHGTVGEVVDRCLSAMGGDGLRLSDRT